jgi:hypothetical protein
MSNEQKIIEGILRIEASNDYARNKMSKAHKPSLGPYSDTNPMRCMDCNLPANEWADAKCCP